MTNAIQEHVPYAKRIRVRKNKWVVHFVADTEKGWTTSYSNFTTMAKEIHEELEAHRATRVVIESTEYHNG